jgi:hypothetical protein
MMVSQPLRFMGKPNAPDAAVIGVRADLRNQRHSVALQVPFRVFLVADTGNLKQEEKMACEVMNKIPNESESSAIFPNESIPVSGADIMRSDAIRASMAIWKKLNPNMLAIIPSMIACVDYRFPFGTEHHHSWYGYRIGIPVPFNVLRSITPTGVQKTAIPVLQDITAN